MKTTLMFRRIANPRRTTLAHLKDASELTAGTAAAAPGPAEPQTPADAAAEPRPLPSRTANPRRTVLTELPQSSAAS